MPNYQQLLRTFKAELDQSEQFKRDMILRLAQQLEKEGQIAVNRINQQITQDLEGYVTKGYVGQCLDKRFKNGDKITRGAEAKPNELKLLVQVGETGIQTTEDDLTDELKRLENQESEDFHKDFRNKLDETKLPELNQEVFMELQRKIQEIDQLNVEVNGLHNEMRQNQQILFQLSKHAGYYVKYDKAFNIIDVKEL
jgi:exonuclease III